MRAGQYGATENHCQWKQEATATIGNQARTTNHDESFSKKLQQSMMNPSANCRTTTIHLAPTMMNPAANSRPTSNQSCQPFTAQSRSPE